MARTLYVRGDSFNARASSGGANGFKFNSGSVTTAAGGLSGTVWDLTPTGVNKYVSFGGYKNTPNGRGFSVGIRLAPSYTGTPAASRVLWSMGIGPNTVTAYVELRHDVTTGNLSLVIKNESGTTCVNTTFGAWSPTSGTYYDIVVKWDGTTTASKVIVVVDNGTPATATASAALSSSWDNTMWRHVTLGYGPNIFISAYKLDEFFIDDTQIDTSSYDLVGGNGALNGASRTALINQAAFDGTTNVDAGIANVRSGTAYTVAGVPLTGTASIPSAANVRSGTAVDATTGSLVVPSLANTKTGVAGDGGNGTYDGSDRWTDPGVANVRSATDYKANSTSNNKTGTVVVPAVGNVKTGVAFDTASTGTYDGSDRWTAPSAGDLRSGTQLKNNSLTLNLTGTLVAPSLANTKVGVAGDGGSGTYDGSDRWTDVGVANVRLASAYKANSTSNNRTGTAAIPGASDVRSGVATDATTGTLVANLAADVKHGVASDGGTGTYQGDDVNDLLLVGELKHGVVVLNRNVSITGTYQGDDVNDLLLAAQLKHGVSVLNRNVTVTGSYRGADLWSSIDASDIGEGVSTTQNGATVVGTLRFVTNVIRAATLVGSKLSGILKERP